MKKNVLISTLASLLFASSVFSQVQTIHNPNVTPTITEKEIIAQSQNGSATDDVIVLNFEGLGNSDPINDFYNGGTSGQGYSGNNYGVQFGIALGLIDEDAGGSGNFAWEPSPSTIMFFLDANEAYMNVAAGFETGFSFYYCALYDGSVSVYDEINGTGNLLGTTLIPQTNPGNVGGDPNGFYDNWLIVSVAFNGIAKSVVFTGSANNVGFDDVTFGSTVPGCVNPTYGGEIGFSQSHCGGLDPDPFVSLAPPSGYAGNLEYKWQFSTDMVNFLDIPFSNVEAYDAGFTDVTTWFKRLARVDCKPDWTEAAESNVVEITILPGILPGPAGEITGQAVVCNYSQAIYCVPYITDATSYIWEYSGTGVIFVEMAKCQSCIILQFTGEATSGILTVRGHNDCGDGLVSPDYPIVVELYPADAGPIAGPIKVNQGQTGVPYSVPVIAYATSYIWSYDGTGVTINGSGNSVTLDFDANATSGWLTVAGNNNCGNGLYTFLPITVDPYTPIYGPFNCSPGTIECSLFR